MTPGGVQWKRRLRVQCLPLCAWLSGRLLPAASLSGTIERLECFIINTNILQRRHPRRKNYEKSKLEQVTSIRNILLFFLFLKALTGG